MERRSVSRCCCCPLLLLLLPLLFLSGLGTCDDVRCSPSHCSENGPEIRFPFRLKGQQPERCGYPGFELTCNGNHTILHLPSSQNLSITAISYYGNTIRIHNPYNYSVELFLHLNLLASPFTGPYTGPYDYDHYNDYHSQENCTFVDCSMDFITDGYARALSCLSSFDHNVFIVRPNLDLADLARGHCKQIKTVKFSYFSAFNMCERSDLYLNWYVHGCEGCELCRYENASSNQIQCFDIPNYYYPSYYPSYGNNFYYGNHKGSRIKHVIIGISVTFFLLLVVAAVAIKVYRSKRSDRKKEMENQVKVEKFLEDYKSLKPTRYSYVEIKRMTNHFRHKLGQGGYGTVFKGKLPNGTLVAVKVLKKSSGGGDGEEFINEVGTIGRIHHVNVVRLLGFCADGFERALIYEFMPNESLEKYIFSLDDKNPLLGWEKLQDIAIGIAKGIEYLHQGCDQRILHFDIKPHNILLDQHFNSKISDFGLAKLCSKEQSIVSMTTAKGTMGYIAPEIFSRNFGNVSYKSDVYSFGMVLLEMVGGRKNIDATVENASQVYFPEWIYNRLHQGEELELRIVAEGDAVISKKMTIVALWCIQWYPVDRPSMKSVVQMLEGSIDNLMIPPNPFGSTSQTTTNEAISEPLESPKLTVISE